MQAQQPLITQYVDLLMQRLKERTTQDGGDGERQPAVVDLAAWFNFTTFDVIGDLAFGEPFGCLEESRYHPWVDAIFRGVKEFGVVVAAHSYSPALLSIVRKLLPASKTGIHQQMDLVHERIGRRLQLQTSRPDFIEAMVTAKSDDGRMLSRDELASNSRVLVLAGSETTATVLAGTAYFLSKHPEAQKKLADEVRSSFASEAEIDLFSVNKLQYMLAVLDEAMRVFPPVPSQLPRVCHEGGDVICGIRVPGGVSGMIRLQFVVLTDMIAARLSSTFGPSQ
jgi:cytochrome P450